MKYFRGDIKATTTPTIAANITNSDRAIVVAKKNKKN